MGNSPSSEDSYGNTRMEPSDFQMVNFNLTTPEEKAMGERMTLSASGREKMGMSDPGGDDDGGSSNQQNGGNAQGKYTPKGGILDEPVRPENKPKQKQITDFLSESQATEYRLGTRVGAEGPGSFLGDADSVQASALGAELDSSMAGVGGVKSPFAPSERGRFLKSQGAGMETGMDATVNMQGGTATPGGDVGVGQQGFGLRALGGGDTVVENMAPPGAEQTDVVASQAQPDVQPDPNLPPLSPQQAVVPDVNYVLPTAGQQQVIAFSPNDPRAVFTARGPLSRNLISERTGFGRKFS